MQLRIFRSFIKDIVTEGNRLQKVDIHGNVLTNRKFTQTQKASFLISIALLFFIKAGFSDTFAGYIISFLSIFIGLFSTIVISLFSKSDDLKQKHKSEKVKVETHTEDSIEIARIRTTRNYLVQFTGLTSYAIYLAICIIILLIFILLHDFFKGDLSKYTLITQIKDINRHNIWNFLKALILLAHRALISYLLINFFVITLYAVTSYFSYISSEYKKQILNDD